MKPNVKCLIVDDREDNLLVFSVLLREEGVEVLTAKSGPEALELLLVHDVALALLDVQMPGMDGFELAELMRGSMRTRHVPIIFITAGVHQEQWTFKGYENGAVDFLYKPFERTVLKSKAEVFFELHRQKQQLALDLRERTETLRLNEMFAAVLGHDLRNPLNAILGFAHVLQSSSNSPSVVNAATRIIASGQRMSQMIEDLVDLSRARVAGGIGLQIAPTDLARVVERVVHEQQVSYPNSRIELRANGDLHGEWDSGRLAQVASNLLGNALKHGDGDAVVEVDLDGTRSDTVSMTVDNAGSIPAELLPHVFNPFRGGRRQEGRSAGLGLGLYIVQQLVHAHGGEVEVQSGQGDRTVFHIRLPRICVSAMGPDLESGAASAMS